MSMDKVRDKEALIAEKNEFESYKTISCVESTEDYKKLIS